MASDKDKAEFLRELIKLRANRAFNSRGIGDERAFFDEFSVFLYKVNARLRIHTKKNYVGFTKTFDRADNVNRAVVFCLLCDRMRAVNSDNRVGGVLFNRLAKASADNSQTNNSNFHIYAPKT